MLQQLYNNDIKDFNRSDLFELSDKDKDNLYIFNLIDNEIDKQEIRDNYRNSLKIVGGFTRDKILKK